MVIVGKFSLVYFQWNGIDSVPSSLLLEAALTLLV
jgi:hypothetical protein